MVIGVLVELSSKNIDKMFDYLVPKHLEEFIKVGIRVEVPFGSQTLEGFVLEIKDENSSDFKLKEIISIKDTDIILNKELLELGKVMQDNTLATLISCYQVMLPKALKAKQGSVINKTNSGNLIFLNFRILLKFFLQEALLHLFAIHLKPALEEIRCLLS